MKKILFLTAFSLFATIGFANNGLVQEDPPKPKQVRAVKMLTIFKLPTQTNNNKTKDVTIQNETSSQNAKGQK